MKLLLDEYAENHSTGEEATVTAELLETIFIITEHLGPLEGSQHPTDEELQLFKQFSIPFLLFLFLFHSPINYRSMKIGATLRRLFGGFGSQYCTRKKNKNEHSQMLNQRSS